MWECDCKKFMKKKNEDFELEGANPSAEEGGDGGGDSNELASGFSGRLCRRGLPEISRNSISEFSSPETDDSGLAEGLSTGEVSKFSGTSAFVPNTKNASPPSPSFICKSVFSPLT